MTAQILLFDGYVPGDAALENSHFMAACTAEKLGADASTLTFPEAIRSRLEVSLDDPSLRGLVLFGHGDPGQIHSLLRAQHRSARAGAEEIVGGSAAGAVYGCDCAPALDDRNVALLRGRWGHALACNVGLSLSHLAVEAGAACFVAYEASLKPEFDPAELPAALRSLLIDVITSTTLLLHRGARDGRLFKAAAQALCEDLQAWIDGPEGAEWVEGPGYEHAQGVVTFARQLWTMLTAALPSAP